MMDQSKILASMSYIIYPFIILYGFYVTVYGDITSGGGFQGGAFIATGLLLITFFSEMRFNLVKLNKYEKLLFLLLISMSFISLVTKDIPMTNPLNINKRYFLVFFNLVLGLKVAAGLINVIESFFEEGDPFV